MHLMALQNFAKLRKEMDNRYFEGLVQTYLLDNPHAAVLILNPVPGLEALEQERVEKMLLEYKAGLTKEELQDVLRCTRELKAYQDEPSSPEELAKIPMLKREDIKKEATPLTNEVLLVDETTLLWQDIFTNGISYIRLLFDAKDLPESLIPYLGILKHVLGFVDTENYSYRELFNEINCHTGGIVPGVSIYGNMRDKSRYRMMFELRVKVLCDKTDFAFAMLREILSRTKLTDKKRLYEIIAQLKSRLQMYLTSSGHSAAAMRAMAKFSPQAKKNDQLTGVAFYQIVEGL